MTERARTDSEELSDDQRPREAALRRMVSGFLLGALIGMGLSFLGISNLLRLQDGILLCAIAGAAIGRTRFQKGLWILSGLTLAVLLIIGYTPLAPYLLHSLERRDPLQKAPAIVVLSSYVQKAQTLNSTSQERVLQGYLLLRQGYADRLVLTHSIWPYGSQVPIVREQMKLLGLDYPVEDAGKVADTHDEALAVARLARQQGWEKVILVTSPRHMRRAAAVFEKAGVKVLCSPCVEGEYDTDVLDRPPGRLKAFSDWLHEAVGYYVYRWRGWL